MDSYLSFSQDNLWIELWPELALALGALLVLGIDLFGRRDPESVKSGSFAIIFQFALLVVHLFDYLLWHHTFHRESFSGMLVHGIQGDVMRSFFLVSSLLVSILAHRHNALRKFRCAEFHHLTMLASAGLMILCQCQNFLLLFVVLETVALSFYPLVAYNRECPKSLEAGIKYLIFGALSSTLLLFGVVLLYGVGTNPGGWGAEWNGAAGQDALSFTYLAEFLAQNTERPVQDIPDTEFHAATPQKPAKGMNGLSTFLDI